MTTTLPRRRWLPQSLAGKAALVSFGGALLVVFAWTAALVLTQWRLDRAIAKARSLGYVESWESAAGALISDSENSAVPLLKAGLLASAAGEEVEKAYKESAQSANVDELVESTAVKLVADPNYEDSLRTAAAKLRYRTTMVIEDIYSKDALTRSAPFHFTSIASVEAAYARRLIKDGRIEDGARRVLRWLRITERFIAREPWVAASFMACSSIPEQAIALNLALRTGTLPRALHDEIEHAAALLDRPVLLASTAISGFRHHELESLARSSIFHRHFLLRPVANVDSIYLHEVANAFLESANDSHIAALARISLAHPLRELPTIRGNKALALGVPQTLKNVRCRFDESTALLRCLRIVNAMAAKNDWKADLDSLGLPSNCLIDPFDGKRLRIKRTADGPIVYSVGGDLTDDGGKLDDSRKPYDIGLGPVKSGKK